MGAGASAGMCPDVDEGGDAAYCRPVSACDGSVVAFEKMQANFVACFEQHGEPNLFVLRDDTLAGGTRGRFIVDFLRTPEVAHFETYVYVCDPYDWWQVTLAHGINTVNKMLREGATPKTLAIVWTGLRKEKYRGREHNIYMENARAAIELGAVYNVFHHTPDMDYMESTFRDFVALDEHLQRVEAMVPSAAPLKDALKYVSTNVRWQNPMFLNPHMTYQFFQGSYLVLGSLMAERVEQFDEVWIAVNSGMLFNAIKQTPLGKEYIAVATSAALAEDFMNTNVVASPGAPTRIILNDFPRSSRPVSTLLPPFPTDPYADGKLWTDVLQAARGSPNKRILFWNCAGRDTHIMSERVILY